MSELMGEINKDIPFTRFKTMKYEERRLKCYGKFPKIYNTKYSDK